MNRNELAVNVVKELKKGRHAKAKELMIALVKAVKGSEFESRARSLNRVMETNVNKALYLATELQTAFLN